MSRHNEYKLSDRVTLKVGDYFRARGGPYYISPDTKQRSSFAERGPFKFLAYCEQGKQKYIEAFSVRQGTMAILSLNKKRKTILPGMLIHRPYEILGGVSKKKKERLDAAQAGKRTRPQAGKGRRKIAPVEPKSAPTSQVTEGVQAAFTLVNDVLQGKQGVLKKS